MVMTCGSASRPEPLRPKPCAFLLPAAMQMGWQRGKEGGVLLAEPNFVSRDERERLCQLMFEVFNVSG